METKIVAGKKIIPIILKADNWKETDIESIKKQRVDNNDIIDSTTQVYFGSDHIPTLFKESHQQMAVIANALYEKIIRMIFKNGYIEVFIESAKTEIPVDVPIILIQDIK